MALQGCRFPVVEVKGSDFGGRGIHGGAGVKGSGCRGGEF